MIKRIPGPRALNVKVWQRVISLIGYFIELPMDWSQL